MATYNPAAIRAAVKALLIGATGISTVYDFFNPTIDGYPCIIFDIDNEDGTMLDDINNLRVITFKVWIAAELAIAGQEAASGFLDTAVQSVINTLEKRGNDTLSGTVDWVMPVSGQRSQVASPDGNFMYQELFLRCNIASSIL